MPLYLFPPALVLGWVAVSLLLGAAGGWWWLARRYRLAAPDSPQKWFYPRLTLVGWVPYARWLTLGVGRDGLTLLPNILYRPGHPPLFVLWADVSVRAVAGLAWGYHEFRFAKAPGVAVRVSSSLALRMLADAGVPVAVVE